MDAENQQERLDAKWIVGFVDGEGCFHVAINKLQKMTLGWQVLPEFRVVQHKRDEGVLQEIKKYFGFGKVTTNHGDRKEYRVRGLKNLNKIIDFFNKNQLQTFCKRKNFKFFSDIIQMMNNKEHLTMEGLHFIAELASKMNTQTKSKFLVSSETICQTQYENNVKI